LERNDPYRRNLLNYQLYRAIYCLLWDFRFGRTARTHGFLRRWRSRWSDHLYGRVDVLLSLDALAQLVKMLLAGV